MKLTEYGTAPPRIFFTSVYMKVKTMKASLGGSIQS